MIVIQTLIVLKRLVLMIAFVARVSKVMANRVKVGKCLLHSANNSRSVD